MNAVLTSLLARMAKYQAVADGEGAVDPADAAGVDSAKGHLWCPAQADEAIQPQQPTPFEAASPDAWMPEAEVVAAQEVVQVEVVDVVQVAHVAHRAHFSLPVNPEKIKKESEEYLVNLKKKGNEKCAISATCATDDISVPAPMPTAGETTTQYGKATALEETQRQKAVPPLGGTNLGHRQPHQDAPSPAVPIKMPQAPAEAQTPAEAQASAGAPSPSETRGDQGVSSNGAEPFTLLKARLTVECLFDRRSVVLPVGARIQVFRQMTPVVQHICGASTHALAAPLAYQALSQGYALMACEGALFRIPAWEVRGIE